ncbi:hypothetical protein HG531_006189 [Fusarium graminearum]|nr:hypothetical protein HG531_006189 [Fusarium graminearum]
MFLESSQTDLLVDALFLYSKLHISFILAASLVIESNALLISASIFDAIDLIRIEEANFVLLATALFDVVSLRNIIVPVGCIIVIHSKHIVVVIVARCSAWGFRSRLRSICFLFFALLVASALGSRAANDIGVKDGIFFASVRCKG